MTAPITAPMPAQGDEIDAALLALTHQPRPWQDVEADVAAVWPGAMLGGDPLRPYAVASPTTADEGLVTITAVQRDGLPDAPLVADLLAGTYGMPTVEQKDIRTAGMHYPPTVLWRITIPTTTDLSDRLALPNVLLVGLGDRDRYRGARLPLGIARLASWLRWAHAGRVHVIDYTLVAGDPLETVRSALTTGAPQVVGVGVNFGQWRMLSDLAELVDDVTASWHFPPVVVLGNILAAFSPTEAAEPFKTAVAAGRLMVATGLGERPLEAVCRSLSNPAAWPSIPGLRQVRGSGRSHEYDRPRGTDKLGTRAEPRPGRAPTLVAPDDSLVLAVATQGGQVSLETSLGCQYGACTFCPRSHKGEGWSRELGSACVAILGRLARLPGGPPALSLVDEEFFGAEGLTDPPANPPGPGSEATRILRACADLGLRYEIYTRLEQLFDRRRSRRWNLRRAAVLAEAALHLRRVFVGVESGSPGQLRRYGKGQTVAQTVDALQVASALGVPLEFGFITFDPLLTPAELGENLAFLARTDVMSTPIVGGRAEAAATVAHYLDGAQLPSAGEPVYRHVAYMATELEVLAGSRYAERLNRRHRELIDGYDPAFARYTTHYANSAIGELAGWCRVWTEGMFAPVYAARMAARAARAASPGGAAEAMDLIRRYRDATCTLLITLTRRLLPDVPLPDQPTGLPELASDDVAELLADLSAIVTGEPAAFDLAMLERRRDA